MLFGMLMSSAMGVAIQMASRIVDAISSQINRFTSGIGSRISGLLRNSFKLLVGLLNLGYQIWDFIDNITKTTFDFLSWLGDVKDCEYMFAMIGRCLLNKTLGSKVTSIQNNIISKINKYGDQINSKLAEEMEDIDTVNNFLSKEVMLINKANKQLANYSNSVAKLEPAQAKKVNASSNQQNGQNSTNNGQNGANNGQNGQTGQNGANNGQNGQNGTNNGQKPSQPTGSAPSTPKK